jgi:hypothetical protein
MAAWNGAQVEEVEILFDFEEMLVEDVASVVWDNDLAAALE